MTVKKRKRNALSDSPTSMKAKKFFLLLLCATAISSEGSNSDLSEILGSAASSSSRWHSRGGDIPSLQEGDPSQPLDPKDLSESVIQENTSSNKDSEQQQKSSSPPTYNYQTHPPHHSQQQQYSSSHQYQRTSLLSEERAILGRAVLTTPHRHMPALRISPGPRPSFSSPQNQGPHLISTLIYVTKFNLCESLGCALRDLRVIDQYAQDVPTASSPYVGSSSGMGTAAFSASSSSNTLKGGDSTTVSSRYSGPAFLARKNCVIVRVGHVRAIVMRDQVLIFLPEVYKQQQDSESDIQHRQQQRFVTTQRLVEALVTYLNSIYHSTPHMSFGGGEYIGEHFIGSKHNDAHGETSKENDRNSNNGPSPPMHHPYAKVPPFELVVIEALLGHVCSHQSSKVSELIQNANDVLLGIMSNFNDSIQQQNNEKTNKQNNNERRRKDAFLEMQAKLGELLPLKNKVDELEARCSEIANAIEDVLQNDEDMAAMRLTELYRQSNYGSYDDKDNVVNSKDGNEEQNNTFEKKRNNSSGSDSDKPSSYLNTITENKADLHVEVELLFEDYLLQMDEMLHSLRSVQSSVRNTEEVVEIELDLIRNRIMRYEMLLELSGLVVGVAAAVTGAFGMNLVNHFEEHPQMFYNVCVTLLLFMGGMGYSILRKLSLDNIL
mmetsp:Transcript_21337/g.31667  ORF Transcript_21337/g.31667 Transcript_21337/m.31667 type:complete len:663 (-) Transcript_21337:501-2489(-)